MEELFRILPFIVPIITAIGGIRWSGWILSKLNISKVQVNVEADRLDNLGKTLNYYQDLVDDIAVKYKTRIADIELEFDNAMTRMKNEIAELKSINNELGEIVKSQRFMIERLNKSLSYYKNKYEVSIG